jgi:hypothetical protein
MSEVRPWLGATVSIARFELTREVKLVNFAANHESTDFIYPDENDQHLVEQSVWTMVDKSFSMPVTGHEGHAEYAPTQVIAEFFKSEGFDGVYYKSRLGEGFNFALFDLNSAELVQCALSRVKSVKYEFESFEKAYTIKMANP